VDGSAHGVQGLVEAVVQGGEAFEHLRGFFADVAVGTRLCDEFVEGVVKVRFFVVAP